MRAIPPCFRATALLTLLLAMPSCDSGDSGSAGGASGGAGDPARPNIILILADDVGYESFGCYGNAAVKTPNVDRLAQTGMRFTHCYSQPLCTPSRVEIMTGRYNFRNYTRFAYLDPKERTFGHQLKAAGYATCVVGKWQLGVRRNVPFAEQTGFDEHCLWRVPGASDRRYWNATFIADDRSVSCGNRYGPDVLCDRLLDFIDRHQSGPFFAYDSMLLPHAPFLPTPESGVADPTAIPAHMDLEKAGRAYFPDMVEHLDRNVGRILQRLDELGIRDRTLVLFVGDNGAQGIVSTLVDGRRVRGEKGRLTEGGTHVPLVASWPGTIAPGTVCDDLIDFSDFLPTLVEAAHGHLPAGVTLDGHSFLPRLLGRPEKPREWTFSWYHSPKKAAETPRWFVRDQHFKLYGDGRLFAVNDRSGKENLLEDEAATRERLQAVLDELRASAPPGRWRQ